MPQTDPTIQGAPQKDEEAPPRLWVLTDQLAYKGVDLRESGIVESKTIKLAAPFTLTLISKFLLCRLNLDVIKIFFINLKLTCSFHRSNLRMTLTIATSFPGGHTIFKLVKCVSSNGCQALTLGRNHLKFC
ncbi:hypothetical protein IEQ34_003978 [Dendrobium chrysotoxum]|uniref:Uncharacterized protein n=1 Tax=Dendrobium chrysotoxum TaxID=161865 RepID=A0AAV7GY17_DENCH|nr:hypothetical protein IEQ34_003978 [Dendrobium chrysotoxum]